MSGTQTLVPDHDGAGQAVLQVPARAAAGAGIGAKSRPAGAGARAKASAGAGAIHGAEALVEMTRTVIAPMAGHLQAGGEKAPAGAGANTARSVSG